ncbi:hypothetical protein PLESTM_001558700 [Pleodorina starrii]|nr:hypothetical protein PLESTM_001558700 [Pleodorina starrii]
MCVCVCVCASGPWWALAWGGARRVVRREASASPPPPPGCVKRNKRNNYFMVRGWLVAGIVQTSGGDGLWKFCCVYVLEAVRYSLGCEAEGYAVQTGVGRIAGC